MKGYVVVVENLCHDNEYAHVSEVVYTDYDRAYNEFENTIADLKRDTWEEDWVTGRYVSYMDMDDGDQLNIYIHEVEIK